MKLSWWWIIKMNYHDKSGSWVCATDPSALSSDSVQKRGDTVSLSLRLKSRNRPECCVALLITSIHLWNNTDSIRLEIQWVRWPRYWIGRRPTAANAGPLIYSRQFPFIGSINWKIFTLSVIAFSHGGSWIIQEQEGSNQSVRFTFKWNGAELLWNILSTCPGNVPSPVPCLGKF